jgi:hypothetical protein
MLAELGHRAPKNLPNVNDKALRRHRGEGRCFSTFDENPFDCNCEQPDKAVEGSQTTPGYHMTGSQAPNVWN